MTTIAASGGRPPPAPGAGEARAPAWFRLIWPLLALG